MGLIRVILIIFLLFSIGFSPIFAQTVSMSTEIFRLEQPFNGTTAERYSRYMDLSTIYLLSGNVELALRACEGALAVFPNDFQALTQQTRFLIALGEYERATVVVNRLMNMDLNAEHLQDARLLDAQLKAFHHADFRSLSALADDNSFSRQRSAIYYTLWRLQGHSSWRNRLNLEFRQSPEARIASGADSGINFAPTPLWILFPGRHNVGLAPFNERPAPAASPTIAPPISGPLLQAGLFGREENARSLSDNIRRAGFDVEIRQRLVNGNNFWVVVVYGGSDVNATIRRLREAGFESFPIAN